MAPDAKDKVFEQIKHHRVSAILRTDDQRLASDAMSAAVAGGFRMIEFTMTTPNALELISEFSENPDLLVGAGTVMSREDARQAVAAGAQFLVSPICDPDVIAEANTLNVVSIPGTVTPTEMVKAHRLGADLVKLFPVSGDVPGYVASILGPLPFLRIFPTSGVTVANFIDILNAGAMGVGFVRSLFLPDELDSGNLTVIESRAADIIQRLRLGVKSE